MIPTIKMFTYVPQWFLLLKLVRQIYLCRFFFFLSFLCVNFVMIFQVMSVKALGTSIKLSFEGKNQLIYAETWFFMMVVAVSVIIQMNYLNKVSSGIVLT